MGYNTIVYTIFGYLVPEEIINQLKDLKGTMDDYWENEGRAVWAPKGLDLGWSGDARYDSWIKAIGIKITDLNEMDKERMRADLLKFKDFLKEKYTIDMDASEPEIIQTKLIT